ncbi:hypothetical protein DFH07DRAFT_774479 [Mycena maculata]|uniref:Uncharacterized protein n=1 Tax=Mycena maculata TaxID=230809 RepID=A0AAD7IY55_9AGAR|nr:hypothetical protein DFH07DRAFT_774479 [Mycena maculata]
MDEFFEFPSLFAGKGRGGGRFALWGGYPAEPGARDRAGEGGYAVSFEDALVLALDCGMGKQIKWPDAKVAVGIAMLTSLMRLYAPSCTWPKSDVSGQWKRFSSGALNAARTRPSRTSFVFNSSSRAVHAAPNLYRLLAPRALGFQQYFTGNVNVLIAPSEVPHVRDHLQIGKGEVTLLPGSKIRVGAVFKTVGAFEVPVPVSGEKLFQRNP